ncbi:unnamed protein product, partial [Medioppia subpectinata]
MLLHIPDSSRLTKSDALFVDVIHTETVRRGAFQWGTGMAKTIGHIDFYPNGLKNASLQPMPVPIGKRSSIQTAVQIVAPMGTSALKWDLMPTNGNPMLIVQMKQRFQYKIAIKMVNESNITDHNHEKHVGKMSLKFPNKSHFVDTTKDSIGLTTGQTYYSVVILADDLNLTSNNDSYVEFKWRMSKMQRIFRAFRRSRSKMLFISEVSVAPLNTGNQTVVRYCNANPMAGVDTDS